MSRLVPICLVAALAFACPAAAFAQDSSETKKPAKPAAKKPEKKAETKKPAPKEGAKPAASVPGGSSATLVATFAPADNVRNEVAAVLNFKTKDGGPATLAVGSASYDLVTKGENAWVKNQSDEGTAIGTMSKGGTMTLTATSARGNKTTDRYSLSGFGQALDRAKRDCP